MLVSLNDVLKSDGKVMQVSVEPEMTQVVFGKEAYPVSYAAPVSLNIVNGGNKVLRITGSTEITVHIPCSRCLEDVPVDLKLSFEREADMKQTAEERIQALDEQVYIDGYHLDVDKLVYSELLVNWPSKVLCKEDCKGICSICGTNLNQHTCSCRNDDPDPRMAKIQEIFNKFKEV